MALTKINEEDHLALNAPFTSYEVGESIFKIHCSKSPRPDEITTEFFTSGG